MRLICDLMLAMRQLLLHSVRFAAALMWPRSKERASSMTECRTATSDNFNSPARGHFRRHLITRGYGGGARGSVPGTQPDRHATRPVGLAERYRRRARTAGRHPTGQIPEDRGFAR